MFMFTRSCLSFALQSKFHLNRNKIVLGGFSRDGVVGDGGGGDRGGGGGDGAEGDDGGLDESGVNHWLFARLPQYKTAAG